MLTIVLKMILCSGILLALYHLVLVKERTFIFNRFYLISALLFSFSIPFATIETKQVEKEIPETVFVGEIQQPILQTPIVQQESFDYTKALLIGYCIVSGILILKIGYSVIRIKKLKGRKITYQNRTVFLLKQDLAPFSFWNTIYLSETYFKDSKIQDSVFLHEEIHVKQKHSADILFVEILKAVFWLNPFLYFYKKAMVNNHEFIADDRVIRKNKNIKSYQELILQEILKQQNLPLIHQFNFNNTKKRFIMMTNKNSKFAKMKNYLAVPAFAVLAIVFAEKTYAKDNTVISNQEERNAINKRPSETDQDNLMTNTNSQDYRNERESVVMGSKGRSFTKGKDTIPSKKNVVENIISKVEEKSLQDISTAVEGKAADLVPAEYPGGVNELRKKVAKNFNSAIFGETNNLVTSTITFVVDKNGSIRDLKAEGENEKFNNEVFRVTKEANENVTWKPATKDGEPVAYRYNLPLAMQFAPNDKTQ